MERESQEHQLAQPFFETRGYVVRSHGIGYELFEMRAYIQDDWKLLRLPESFGTGGWQLYNLATDPGEIHDVSDENPDLKAAERKSGRHMGARFHNEIQTTAGAYSVGGVSFSITWSRLKLAAFWRGGYSWNVARNLPT